MDWKDATELVIGVGVCGAFALKGLLSAAFPSIRRHSRWRRSGAPTSVYGELSWAAAGLAGLAFIVAHRWPVTSEWMAPFSLILPLAFVNLFAAAIFDWHRYRTTRPADTQH